MHSGRPCGRRRGRRGRRARRTGRNARQRGELHDGVPQFHRHHRGEHPREGHRLRARGGQGGQVKAGVIGAAGYAGGELLRLLLGHPEVREVVAGSSSLAGKPVTVAHPNLRKRTALAFVAYEEVTACDVLFLSLPNGSYRFEEFCGRGKVIIDLSSDHRLRDAADYQRWYGAAHPHPERLGEFVYGMPELHRDRIAGGTRISGAGCNATPAILALLPLVPADVVDRSRAIAIEAKVGSSEG